MYAASPWCGTKLNCISWQLCQKCELVRRDVTKSKDGMRLRLYWTFFAKKKRLYWNYTVPRRKPQEQRIKQEEVAASHQYRACVQPALYRSNDLYPKKNRGSFEFDVNSYLSSNRIRHVDDYRFLRSEEQGIHQTKYITRQSWKQQMDFY